MSYSSVKVFVNAEQHKSLLEFCDRLGAEYEVDVTMNLSMIDDDYKKPTPALKAFCGPQWLNSKGLCQPKTVIDLILSTAKRLQLNKASGILELNSTLQEILQTNETSILLSSLPSRINDLLTEA